MDAPKRINGRREAVSPVVVNLQIAPELVRSRLDAAGTDKKPMTEVTYRQAFGPDRCASCVNGRFDPGTAAGLCTAVAGQIRQAYVCDLFAARSGGSDNVSD